jgi:hypothetical protein
MPVYKGDSTNRQILALLRELCLTNNSTRHWQSAIPVFIEYEARLESCRYGLVL